MYFLTFFVSRHGSSYIGLFNIQILAWGPLRGAVWHILAQITKQFLCRAQIGTVYYMYGVDV